MIDADDLMKVQGERKAEPSHSTPQIERARPNGIPKRPDDVESLLHRTLSRSEERRASRPVRQDCKLGTLPSVALPTRRCVHSFVAFAMMATVLASICVIAPRSVT